MNKIIIASGPIIIEDNKALLNKHGDDNFWKFCGGQIKEGENLKQAATRRAKEEMGIDLEILNPTPIITHTQKEDGTDVILVHFISKKIGEIKPGPDIREWKWQPIDNLPNDCAPNIKPVIQQIMK